MRRTSSARTPSGPARHNVQQRDNLYATRILLCTATALVVLLLIVKVWPLEQPSRVVPDPEREIFALAVEEILPVVHSGSAPPPPPPPIPVEVRDDIPLETPILDFDLALPAIGTGESSGIMDSGDDVPAGGLSASAPPRPLRFIEPENTREARRRGVRARIVVRVEVDSDGIVGAAQIIERHMGDGPADSAMKPVDHVGYGLEEAALSAAEQWLFRPARHHGEAVAAHYDLTFSFGV